MAGRIENAPGRFGSGEGFGGPIVFADVAGNGVLEIDDSAGRNSVPRTRGNGVCPMPP